MVRAIALLALAGLFGSCGGTGERESSGPGTVTVEIGRSSQASPGRGQDEPRPEAGSSPEVPRDETCDGASTPTTESTEREAERTIRCLTNAVRRNRGRAELAFDRRLARAAGTRSTSMVQRNYFSHTGPSGSNVRRAVRGTGYLPENRSWLLGENIGWAPEGEATPANLMSSWLESPTHRANILNEAFTEIGVGAVTGVPESDAEPGATYTQVFGVTGRAARRAQTG